MASILQVSHSTTELQGLKGNIKFPTGTAGVEPAIDRLEGDCIILYATCPLVKRDPDNSKEVARNEVPFGFPLNLYSIGQKRSCVNPSTK
jgi:hypothetical protein